MTTPSPTAPSPTDLRFFTENWTLTLPSHPHLLFTRLTPLNHPSWLLAISSPTNTKPPNSLNQDPDWETTRLSSAASRFQTRWTEHLSKHNGLEVLVLSATTGAVLGNGGCFEVLPGRANIGIEVLEGARGKGVGGALMRVLLRLSCEVEVERVHCGTMKGNAAMRGLARSLGFEEREVVVEMPGRGVVAEVMYEEIERGRWRELEMGVEFLGVVS